MPKAGDLCFAEVSRDREGLSCNITVILYITMKFFEVPLVIMLINGFIGTLTFIIDSKPKKMLLF